MVMPSTFWCVRFSTLGLGHPSLNLHTRAVGVLGSGLSLVLLFVSIRGKDGGSYGTSGCIWIRRSSGGSEAMIGCMSSFL